MENMVFNFLIALAVILIVVWMMNRKGDPFDTNQFLSETRDEYSSSYSGESYLKIRPAVVCYDGFRISIQASRYHYCTPRTNHGPYGMVELGFPSQADDVIAPYAENPDEPTRTVYGYVPVEVVDMLIDKHRGAAHYIHRGGWA